MSLYNLLFGTNAAAPLLLAALGLTENDIPRFRDCYVDGEYIVIHTRTGGGNRDYYESAESCRNCYPEYFNDGPDEPAGPWNSDLAAHPCYVRDEDDDFDSTYADFYFKFPEEYAEDLNALSAVVKEYKPSEKWQALFDAMRKETP